jgi:hypothetical protein
MVSALEKYALSSKLQAWENENLGRKKCNTLLLQSSKRAPKNGMIGTEGSKC